VEGRNRDLAAMVVSRQYFADALDPRGPCGPFPKGYLHVWYTDGIPEIGVGYGRIFFLGDGSANVGVAVYGRNLPGEASARGDALRRLHEAVLSRPEELMQRQTFAAGGYSVPRHEAGLLRVDDAGSTSHPTSGEGIGFSLEAGRLAASWTAEAKSRDDFSATLLSDYARLLGAPSSLRQPRPTPSPDLSTASPASTLWSPSSRGARRTGGCAARYWSA
jgi:flavin-dependent dehydrogenase